MLNMVFLLVLAGALLAVAPQLIGYGVAALCWRQNLKLWAVLIGMVIPPAIFWATVVYFYSAETASVLQSGISADGGIQVSNVRLGTQIHAGLAVIIQIYSAISRG